MCLLILFAVVIGMAILKRTKNPVVAILSALVAWWLLRFIIAYMIVISLLKGDWEDDCDHTPFC